MKRRAKYYKEYYFSGIPLEPFKKDNKSKLINIKPVVIQLNQPEENYDKNEIMPVFQNIQLIQTVENYNINEIIPAPQNQNYEINQINPKGQVKNIKRDN